MSVMGVTLFAGGTAMMNTPLHRPTPNTCSCCGLRTMMTLVSQSDHRLCEACKMHQGGTYRERREDIHRNMWSQRLASQHQQAREALERATEQRDALRKELEEERAKSLQVREELEAGFQRIPTVEMQRWIVAPRVEAAEHERELAYRKRDAVLGRLWAISRWHRRVGVDRHDCVCGVRVESCKVGGEIDEIADFLFSWEAKQVERYKKGLPNALPEGHPARSQFRELRDA
jgi:hypothetical protein